MKEKILKLNRKEQVFLGIKYLLYLLSIVCADMY